MSDDLPWFVKGLVPKNKTQVQESSWSVFPYSRTRLTMKQVQSDELKLCTEIYTIYTDNQLQVPGQFLPQLQINPFSLTAFEFAQLDVIDLDIRDDTKVETYVADLDPKLFRPNTTNNGPLTNAQWYLTIPSCSVYRLTKLSADIPFVPTNWLENHLKNKAVSETAHYLRTMVCTADIWFNMSDEELLHRLFLVNKGLI